MMEPSEPSLDSVARVSPEKLVGRRGTNELEDDNDVAEPRTLPRLVRPADGPACLFSAPVRQARTEHSRAPNAVIDVLAELAHRALADAGESYGLDQIVQAPGRDAAEQAS